MHTKKCNAVHLLVSSSTALPRKDRVFFFILWRLQIVSKDQRSFFPGLLGLCNPCRDPPALLSCSALLMVGLFYNNMSETKSTLQTLKRFANWIIWCSMIMLSSSKVGDTIFLSWCRRPIASMIRAPPGKALPTSIFLHLFFYKVKEFCLSGMKEISRVYAET